MRCSSRRLYYAVLLTDKIEKSAFDLHKRTRLVRVNWRPCKLLMPPHDCRLITLMLWLWCHIDIGFADARVARLFMPVQERLLNLVWILTLHRLDKLYRT